MSRTAGEARTAWFMSLPALTGFGLFVAAPFVFAIVASFTNLRLGSPLPTRFVGAEQYFRILGDASFRDALRNNLYFTLIVVPVQTTLALGLALLLNGPIRARSVFRALFFLPVVFPMALICVVWNLLYAPGESGFLNGVLHTLSFGLMQPIDFLHNERWALPAIIALSIWQGVGLQMVILLAGLQGIRAELYEAASLDGARRMAQFRHVTLPQLRNPLAFTVLLTTVLAFRVFDQVQILTQGGPNGATTTIMFEAVRRAFERQQIGAASAMSVLFFVLVLILTLAQRRVYGSQRA